MSDAACRGLDPALFHPKKGRPSRYDGTIGSVVLRGQSNGTAAAKAVCRRCPVVYECLEYALRHHENCGVWGGTSAKERRNIQRRRLAAAAAVA